MQQTENQAWLIEWPREFGIETGAEEAPPKKTNHEVDLYAAPPRRLSVLVSAVLVGALLAVGWHGRQSGNLIAESGVGYALGIAGTVLMLLLGLYPLRKKVRLMRRWIPIRYWFTGHLIIGILGPTLVVLHANFRLGSVNSATVLISTLLVAVSGFVGLYLYTKLHCDLFEQVTTLKALRRESETIREGSLFVLGFTPELQGRLIAFEEAALAPTHGLFTSLWQLFSAIIWTRWTHLRLVLVLRRTLRAAGLRNGWNRRERRRRSQAARVHIRTHLVTVRRIAEYRFYERLSSLWRLFHLPLLFFLLLAVVMHVIAVHMY